MAGKHGRVVVAMSGGVDSSVAACLLVEQGYDVTGLYMRVGAGEPVGEGEPVGTGQGPGVDERPGTGESPGTPLADAARRSVKSHGGDPAVGSREPAAPPAGTSSGRERVSCCGATDAADARLVAGMLGIPFYSLNFESDFDRIIDLFAGEYVRGRTPNPCIVCNERLKFGKLVDYADAMGAAHIATGHYARIARRNGLSVLTRGRDPKKDQSYVLFSLNRSVLDRVLFPVGELTKAEVRATAARLDLPNRDKPDSVEICFAPDRDYARIVRQRRPEAFAEGDVVDAEGRVIGHHKGIAHHTIGQRRGLGIATGTPIYVTRLDAASNTVTMGNSDALLAHTLVADRANWIATRPEGSFRATVKIRYLHEAAPAAVEMLEGGRVRVVFDEAQRAITPGQAVVFYDGDVVLGGAWIESSGGDLPRA